MTPPITGSRALWRLWFGIPVPSSWVDQFKLTGGHNCGELGTTVPGRGMVPEEIFPEVTTHRVPGGVLGHRFDPICHRGGF
jgi:hypothetical protein